MGRARLARRQVRGAAPRIVGSRRATWPSQAECVLCSAGRIRPQASSRLAGFGPSPPQRQRRDWEKAVPPPPPNHTQPHEKPLHPSAREPWHVPRGRDNGACHGATPVRRIPVCVAHSVTAFTGPAAGRATTRARRDPRRCRRRQAIRVRAGLGSGSLLVAGADWDTLAPA